MSRDTSNDNEALPGGSDIAPDPHGLAALLLVESLLHTLVARSAISTAEAIDAVADATEIEAVMIADERYARVAIEKSIALLDAIALSLRRDAHEASE